MSLKKVPSQKTKDGAKVGWVLANIPANATPVVFADKLWFWDQAAGELIEAEACRTDFLEMETP